MDTDDPFFLSSFLVELEVIGEGMRTIGARAGREQFAGISIFLAAALVGKITQDRIQTCDIHSDRIPTSVVIAGIGFAGHITSIQVYSGAPSGC
jgi:hypothetical protein